MFDPTATSRMVRQNPSMSQLTRSQVRKLDLLLDLVLSPEKYGCSFEKGNPETFEERAGKIIKDATGVVDELLDPNFRGNG